MGPPQSIKDVKWAHSIFGTVFDISTKGIMEAILFFPTTQ
jgi:hypothetical protein